MFYIVKCTWREGGVFGCQAVASVSGTLKEEDSKH